MLVSLHGSYFRDNYGDILLMEIFTKWIKEFCPDAAINYPKLNTSKITGLKGNFTTGLLKLIKSDALVFFGGGYFGEQPQHKTYWSIRNYFRHIVIGNLAILFNIPYVIIGVEFGPISKSWFKRCVMRTVRHAKYVVARNEQSVRFLKDNGAENVMSSMDAVLSLTSENFKDTNDQVSVLLHLPGAYKSHETFAIIVKELIYVLKSKGIQEVCFVEDDREQYAPKEYNTIFDSFKEACISISIHKYNGTSDLVFLINKAEYVITTKLHVGITALALNKKVFSIYHHPKTIRLHRQVGNEANCMSIKDVAADVRFKIEQFFHTESYTLPNDCRKSALCNKEILFKFLKSI